MYNNKSAWKYQKIKPVGHFERVLEKDTTEQPLKDFQDFAV